MTAAHNGYQRSDVAVRASASHPADMGLIRISSQTKGFGSSTLSFFAGPSGRNESVEKKSAGLLFVSLGKALYGISSSLCSRQMVEPNSLPIVMT